MKRKRRILWALVLCIALAALTACGGSDSPVLSTGNDDALPSPALSPEEPGTVLRTLEGVISEVGDSPSGKYCYFCSDDGEIYRAGIRKSLTKIYDSEGKTSDPNDLVEGVRIRVVFEKLEESEVYGPSGEQAPLICYQPHEIHILTD